MDFFFNISENKYLLKFFLCLFAVFFYFSIHSNLTATIIIDTADSTTSIDKRNNSIDESKFMSGIVLDKTNKKPVPSATVRIAGTNRGTICLKNGSFRLPKSYFINKSDIRITAIGYTSKTLTLDLTKDTVTIYLEQDPVKLKEVVVTGEIEVNEIIRRAIAKKEANRKKYKTMQGLLYSKFMLDTRKTVSNFNIGGSSAEQNTLSFNLSLQDSNETKKDSLLSQFAQGFIGENFSKRFIDLEKNIDKTIIVNRRQTANFPKSIDIRKLY
ncbi:hypothetical protein SDC9_143195 [bioreactor metagenome]|uniref:TonB-dependent receptor SusC n=1 Tax=bioreactor metagenome TaxID=1076179 RepID=A0A645E3D0_9ZZZZ